MRIFLIFITFLILSSRISAQTLVDDRLTKITGVVEDENGKGIVGVSVQFNHALYGYAQNVTTNSSGQFFFENLGSDLSLFSRYTFSYRKAGYAPKDVERLLNDPTRVTLKKGRSGYILVKCKAGVLKDIKAGANDNSIICKPSDEFGYIRIEIPNNLPKDKSITITVLGNSLYLDKIIETTIGQLEKEIIECNLTQLDYPKSIKKLNDLINDLKTNPDETLENNYIRIFNHIDNMKLTKREQEEWQSKKSGYTKIYNFYMKSQRVQESFENRNDTKSEFDDLWNELENADSFEKKIKGFDKVFMKGIAALDYDLEIYKTLEISSYFLEDLNFLGEFLQDEELFLTANKDLIRNDLQKLGNGNLEKHFKFLDHRKNIFNAVSSDKN